MAGAFNVHLMGLTKRERECLSLAAQGLNDTEVGKVLGIRPRTVRVHIFSGMAHLKATSRVHAVAMVARRVGFNEGVKHAEALQGKGGTGREDGPDAAGDRKDDHGKPPITNGAGGPLGREPDHNAGLDQRENQAAATGDD